MVETTESPHPVKDEVSKTSVRGPGDVFRKVGGGFAHLGDFQMLPVLVVIVAVLATFADGVLSPTNLGNVLSQSAVIGIAAIGATFVILTGGIDLSVGSTISASGVAAAWVLVSTGNIALGLAAGLAVGALAGALMGLLVGRMQLEPFIVTLVGMFIISGVALWFSRGATIAPVPSQLAAWTFSSVAGIPWMAIVAMGLFVVAQLVLTKTVWGRRVILIGANRRAAEISGTNVRGVLIAVYALAGSFAAIAGFILTASLTGANSDMGAPHLLNVIGAVALGGTSLLGGRGSVTRTAIGTLILGFLRNGLNLLGMESYDQQIVIGLAIIGAVTIDFFTHRKRK